MIYEHNAYDTLNVCCFFFSLQVLRYDQNLNFSIRWRRSELLYEKSAAVFVISTCFALQTVA